MKSDFFSLVPDRCKFDKFWAEIRKRNRWLIMLRYCAIAMLASFALAIDWLKDSRDHIEFNTLPLWSIALTILIYNVIFHRLWNYLAKKRNWHLDQKIGYPRKGFHSLHFSLMQICFDFAALMLFIYFTGGVETPLYAFFIFHVIIGSMLLPAAIISIIITATFLITLAGALLEYYAVIPHYAIKGVMANSFYNDITYIAVFFTLFGIVLYISIYLANSITKQLYLRERSLTNAYEQLEEAERAKSRYVMSVVHDLKTPVAAVITYLDMLLEGRMGSLEDTQKPPLERSKIRLWNAITIINDILYISQLKLEAGLEKNTDISLTDMFAEIFRDFHVIIASKNIDYQFVSELTQVSIKGEDRILKLALSNIVSNAVKYTNDGGAIRVKLSERRNSVIVSVADNGIGIPDNEKGKVFEDFYRTSLSKKKSSDGSGLGLSITLETIRKYGGTIRVESPSYLKESDTMPGSEFIIELPKE